MFGTHSDNDYMYLLLRNNTQKIKNGNEVLFRFHFLGVGSYSGEIFSIKIVLLSLGEVDGPAEAAARPQGDGKERRGRIGERAVAGAGQRKPERKQRSPRA